MLRAVAPFEFILAAGLLLSLALTSAPGSADAVPFVPQDLYLISRSLPGPSGTIEGIVRIEPLGTATLVHQAASSIVPILVYDRHRELLVFREQASILGLDADGLVTTLAAGLPNLLASRSDGILYLWNNLTGDFSYLDSANVEHDLLDAGGAGAFGVGGERLDEMIYDAETGSIVAFSYSDPNSACGITDVTYVMSIPLMPDGTQVAGAISTTTVDVSSSAEHVVGSGHTPTGGILFVVDTNSLFEEGKFQLLDPVSMAISIWSSGGGFSGSAAVSAGTYSTFLDAAVIDDSAYDILRYYTEGFGGEGQTLATTGQGISGGGHSEHARMVEIPSGGVTAVPPPMRSADAIFHAPRPNPFNPTAVLEFELGRAQRVRLEILDVRGRRVKTLIHDRRGPGLVQVTWNGRDQAGHEVPSGVYFARLLLDTSSATRRMVLLK